MGKHAEWRKLVKKLRRKRIRQKRAKEREDAAIEARRLQENSPKYQEWLSQQKATEKFAAAEEARRSAENHQRWLEAEEESQKRWRELQLRLAKAREEKAKQEERIRMEWEQEQKKIREIEEKNRREKEEKEMREAEVRKQIDNFIALGSDMPEELNVSFETNPGKPPCPFFRKTGACRFGDSCSRNHVRPGISRVLLMPGFYCHFGLEHSAESEYGSDVMLEYDDKETYGHFSEFFKDVVPEFEKHGHVRQFKVCSNQEPHLRGNVYVEYSTTREAIKALRVFQGRWYNGKRLNVEFCNIDSWKAAICGLNYRGLCPKGRGCNFLHVFRNPHGLFCKADYDQHRTPPRKRNGEHANEERGSSSRDWRWSESPERGSPLKEQSKSSRSRRKHSKKRSRSRSKSHSSRRSSHSSSVHSHRSKR